MQIMERQQPDRTRLLPDDVLRRLAPRGLATSRCVCTAWRAAIDARGLLRADLLPPRALAGLFVNFEDGFCRYTCKGLLFSRPSASAEATGYRLPYAYVQDHCNGLLLLLQSYRAGTVLNLATGRSAPLPEWPPPPTGMEYFHRDTYLVFDPAAEHRHDQYEVVAIPRVPSRDVSESDDEELEKKAKLRPWPPVRRRRKIRRVGRSLRGSEWPPSPYVLDVFSSATGRWEKRSFTRDGEAAGTTIADMQLDHRWASWAPHRRSVYWRGALYVHCENGFVLRISMSNNTYRIVKPPREVSDSCRDFYLHLGRSEKGVYSALIDGSKLQVWILEESSSRGEMEWILRHHIARELLQASANYLNDCRRQEQEQGPWILRGLYHRPGDDDVDDKEPVEQRHTFDEWNSDDDDNLLNVGDRKTDENWCGFLEILGFHPYKEIVFLNTSRLDRGLAYHLKTSKLEDLGYLYPPRSSTNGIESCVQYTPCLAGELPKVYKYR